MFNNTVSPVASVYQTGICCTKLSTIVFINSSSPESEIKEIKSTENY